MLLRLFSGVEIVGKKKDRSLCNQRKLWISRGYVMFERVLASCHYKCWLHTANYRLETKCILRIQNAFRIWCPMWFSVFFPIWLPVSLRSYWAATVRLRWSQIATKSKLRGECVTNQMSPLRYLILSEISLGSLRDHASQNLTLYIPTVNVSASSCWLSYTYTDCDEH